MCIQHIVLEEQRKRRELTLTIIRQVTEKRKKKIKTKEINFSSKEIICLQMSTTNLILNK